VPGAGHSEGHPDSTAPATPTALRAEQQDHRVSVWVGDRLFTEYRFGPELKYPYFYPLNGPRTGRSVTVHRTEPYPHHSSLFFGCDRVNGGNYWQEGLERGQILSTHVRLVRASGAQVMWEQSCRWERPGAEAPFEDRRQITVTAPGPDLRFIDWEITLTARIAVRIERSNHSLFAVRVAPELAVQGGGALRNAHGDLKEAGTFGKAAPWADYRGRHAGETEGVALFSHPQNRGFPERWFTRDYGFMSPTPIYWLDPEVWVMAAGETWHLTYRVVVHAGDPDPAQVEQWYQTWARTPPPAATSPLNTK
jgi:hypothetical protein